ncbi:gephyrin-like molybdotransferase receptor GlpR [Corynebacterium hansenii]|uniref:Gephyrin-like molybdotransferase receptor GlpR n=1 Tax=Corynebacterium hansenii TaxID=394964 RepID=A0ABV7ZS49_9CORY|nr:gephyrin-like molybdotransferase receptor GlpR [Corynebacterium hansenii]WJZ00805.1 hypothetical protein CHAN_11035 [Corynebacterium hansenii]
MSSSLLLVLIVVVWLFVLAPLVVNTRQPIRRTSEALGRTRLLHQGGETVATKRRRPTLTERDVRKPGEEVDESLETVDAELDDLPTAGATAVRGRAGRGRDDLDDDILIDDPEDAAADTAAADGDAAAERAGRGADGSGDGARIEDDAEAVPAVVEGDVVYELEAGASERDSERDGAGEPETTKDAEAGVSVTGAEQGADTKLDDADAVAEEPAGRGAVAYAAAGETRAYLTPEDFLVVDDETAAEEAAAAPYADAEGSGDGAEGADAGSDAAARYADADPASDYDYDDDAFGAPRGHRGAGDRYDELDDFDDTLTDDDLAFAERRRGRGGFDPVSDARYAETRFARRRRSVGVLAAFIVVGAALGFFIGGWTWWLPLAGAGLLVLYLVYLRRTVIAENELRARRIRRMKMARLGVRNSEDEELGIPERLRRPGAVVVELDDEDPDFADLPYSTYESPEQDIRRAAGQ